MTSKLYKAVDKKNGVFSAWLVNNKGVAVMYYLGSDDRQVDLSMENELIYAYAAIERFNDAVDPVLIAAWLLEDEKITLPVPDSNEKGDSEPENKVTRLDILDAINGAASIKLGDALELVETLMDAFDIKHK